MNLVREHFYSLLNGDGEPVTPIDNDEKDILLSDYDEIRIAIVRLKNKKTAGADARTKACLTFETYVCSVQSTNTSPWFKFSLYPV